MDMHWILDADFDDQGYPIHRQGVTPQAGLYFIGLPWLTTRGSGFIVGVGADAENVVQHLASRGRQSQRDAVATGAQGST
jgi:putative flavoprotein involved in K+ transport